jgi:hypothetical protein
MAKEEEQQGPRPARQTGLLFRWGPPSLWNPEPKKLERSDRPEPRIDWNC